MLNVLGKSMNKNNFWLMLICFFVFTPLEVCLSHEDDNLSSKPLNKLTLGELLTIVANENNPKWDGKMSKYEITLF